MSKKMYRFFYGFLDAQQRFLNRMAGKGWRLVRTGRLVYEFESCGPDAYSYCIDFVAHKSCRSSKDYQRFLEEMGYRVMTKPVNLNFSLGKVRFRPWGEGLGKVATAPGAFNKELLIVEKPSEGKPFKLHTSMEDRIAYYGTLRSAWTALALGLAAAAVYSFIRDEALWKSITWAILALVHLRPAVHSHHTLLALKSESEVTES